MQVFEEHNAEITQDVTVSPDGTKAISTGIFAADEADNEAILWDTSTLEVIQRLPGFYSRAQFLPDGRTAVLSGNANGNDVDNGQLLLVHWDLESGEVINWVTDADIQDGYALDLSPDGTSVFVVAWATHMHQYDIDTFTKIQSYPLPRDEEWLVSVDVFPDGKIVLAGGDLGDIILFDVPTGEELRRYNQGSVTWGLDISDDGQHFLSAASDGSLMLWDVASGEVLRTFSGHTEGLESGVFTPDESQLVSGSADGTLILWDVATGEALRNFNEHGETVSKVAVSPDGELAYSTGYDGQVFVRPIGEQPVDEILAYINENRVLREFTCEERRQYRILPLCDENGVVHEDSN